MTAPAPHDLPADLRFPENEIELLYSLDWWDGPMNGLARHKGRLFWFQFYCDDGAGKDYFYQLHPIAADEEQAALTWFARYKEFQQRWIPSANNPSTRDLPSANALQEQWERFTASRPNYSSQPVTGWFCSEMNSAFAGVQLTSKK